MKKISIILCLLILFGCSTSTPIDNDTLSVVATTTMVADLVSNIGGDKVNVTSLMEAGVDPHLYKAKESDTQLLLDADMIFYNGLHLEAKIIDIFETMDYTFGLDNGINEKDLLYTQQEAVDPHIWFDVSIWKQGAIEVCKQLSIYDPSNASYFENNLNNYLLELDALQDYIDEQISLIPEDKRILITAHDAFNYFAHSNGFEVLSIQGLSTQSEAATSDISELASFISTKEIPAVFVESSISSKSIEALQAAVKAKGYDVQIGGELYSDSLKENTSYIETYKLNVDTIVKALAN